MQDNEYCAAELNTLFSFE